MWHNRNNTFALIALDMDGSCQCFKHFAGLHLRVCRNKPIFKIICDHKCCVIQHHHAFLLKYLVFKSEEKLQHNEFRNFFDLKNWPFLKIGL